MRNRYYQIDGVNELFATLKDAKYYIYVAFTDKERAKYLPTSKITKVVNGQAVTYTPVIVEDNGKYKFGRTIKY